MKKKNIVLLALLSLTLVGCGNTSSNTSTADDSGKISDTTTTTDTTTNPTTDSTTSDTSTSSETSTIPVATDWASDIKEDMKKYLGGSVVPFIDLKNGNNNIVSSWSTKNLTLTLCGGNINGDLTKAEIDAAKATYENASWTITSSSDNKLEAKNDTLHLTISFYVNTEESNEVTLEIFYDEPYENSLTSWPAEVLKDMNKEMANHGNDIPFVNLGTVNLDYIMGRNRYTITGGTYTSEILTKARTAFTEANSKISADANKWVLGAEDAEKFEASITLADGVELSVSIVKPYTDASTRGVATMVIEYTPAFNVPETGSWPTSISSYFTSNFDGHSVPFFYIGNANDDITISSEEDNSITFKGQELTWNDKIFKQAEDAFDDDDNGYWDYDYDTTDGDASMQKLVATCTYDDGCSLTVTIENASAYLLQPQVKVVYSNGYNPAADADWTDTTKQAFTDYLEGNTIPYVYLNQDEEDEPNWDEQESTLEIMGGSYIKGLLTGADAAFKKDSSWTGGIVNKTGISTADNTTKYTYQVFEATKTLTGGKSLTVTVKDSEYNTVTGEPSSYGYCMVSIYFSKPYSLPTGDKAVYDDDTKEFVNTKMVGHTLPFIYLNASNLKDSTDNNTTFSLIGGRWDDKITSDSANAFTTAGWTASTNDVGETIYTKSESDGCSFSAKVYKNENGYAALTVTVNEVFNENNTSWGDDVSDKMKAVIGDSALPFFNLGTQYCTTEGNSSTYVKIKSNVWKDSIFESAKTALSGDGYTAFYDGYKADDGLTVLEAFKKDDSGNVVYLNLQNKDGGASLILIKFNKETAYSGLTEPKTEWTDNDKKALAAISPIAETKVPFLFMGGNTGTDYVAQSTVAIFSRTNGVFYTAMFDYYDALVKAGYTKLSLYTEMPTGITVKAIYEDDNNKIELYTSTRTSGSWMSRTTNEVLNITVTSKTSSETTTD